MNDLFFLASIGTEHEFLRGFRPETSSGTIAWWWIIFATALAALAAWAVAKLLQRDRRRHGPALRLLSRRLGLHGEQRRLVEQMARTAGFRTAGSVLISRGCFDIAMTHFVAKYGQAGRLRAIRQLVFD